jgi:hypothetical protein
MSRDLAVAILEGLAIAIPLGLLMSWIATLNAQPEEQHNGRG